MESKITGGLFVSFEGCEGGGKTGHINDLALFLRAARLDVLSLREPGGTPIGEKIRHILKHSTSGEKMTPEAELLLMNASRAQLVREVINPALRDGKVVICDRFYDSSIAYQGYGREMPLDEVRRIIGFVTGGLKPDITFLLNVPSDIGIKNKRTQTGEALDRFELEEPDFHKRVYNGFLEIATREPERFRIIDYVHGPDGKTVMQKIIRAEITSYLKARKGIQI